VTSLEYQAYPLGPDVWVTFIGYEWSDAKQVLQGFRDFAATAPDGFSALCVCWTVPEIDDFPKDAWGKPFVVIVGPYAGTVDEGQAVTKPLASLGNVLGDLSGAMPYVEAQKALFDEDYPSGDRYYWRSTYIRELSDQVIDALIDLTESRPSPRSSLDIWLMGGEIDRKDPHHAAFGARGAPYLIGIEANWSDPATDADNFAWTRAAGNRMAPFSTGASYLNFEDPDDARATQAAHGGGFDQLLKVKQEYDPQNLFRSRRGLAAEP
jgi:hypothetical protein